MTGVTAPVIHICSWPGAGKATIGRILAARLGGRLIDNHLSLDPASALFSRDDPRHARLRATLRAAIDAAALTLPPEMPLVVTDALSDSDADAALFAPTLELARARGAALRAITLDISPEENRRRIVDPSRGLRAKLTDPDILDSLRGRHHLLGADGAISLDITNLTAEEAAATIQEMLGLARATPA